MKWRKKGAILLTAALAAVCFTGCKDGGEPKIIGEKQESDTYEQDDEVKIPEEKAESIVTVREQVQAPERYQTEVEEDRMVLSADAPVTVPDVETAALGTSRSVDFTEEEYSLVKKTLTDMLQIQWEEDQTELIETGTAEMPEPIGTSIEAVGLSTSEDEYRISYRRYEEGVPWANSTITIRKNENYGKSSTKSPDISEIGEDMDGQPAGRGAELEEMAEKLIQAAGFEDFQLYRGRWQRSYYNLSGTSWSEAEYCITFTPKVAGIAATRPEVGLLGNAYIKGPAIHVIYREDGALDELNILGKEEIQVGDANESFLLPFEAVQQLFEQYCRDFFRPESLAEAGYPSARAHIKVKNVKLEYTFLMPEDKTKKESELIPVWNFYGSIENHLPPAEAGDNTPVEYWTTRQEPEGRILSIRADDGQILVD